MNIFRAIGKGMAKTAQGLAKGAVWVSQHPEVVTMVANISGNAKVIQGAQVLDTIEKGK